MEPKVPQRQDAMCVKCEKWKLPTKGYMRLLKLQDLPYICKTCRESQSPPPMNLGKLGWL